MGKSRGKLLSKVGKFREMSAVFFPLNNSKLSIFVI